MTRLSRIGSWVMRELALFAGAGGGILGGLLLGWRTVCAVEYDPYARAVLLARQRDGQLERFPIWDDVRTFNGIHWQGSVDVVTGGFPCQDISSARGKDPQGISGKKSGLWVEMARIIREVQPRFIIVENSPMLVTRGLDVVLADLATMGFNARWGVLSGGDVGARHERERLWIVGWNRRNSDQDPTEQIRRFSREERTEPLRAMQEGFSAEPDVGRKADGLAHWMDRLGCLGNGQIPAVAALAWREYGPRESGK